MAEWAELTRLTGGEDLVVERVRIRRTGVAVEGEFDLPRLAGLTGDDQVFVAAFVRSHGSIKEMERLFGVSYPTVKNRLNRIGERLGLVEVARRPSRAQVLDRLDAGEISADEAAEELTRC